MSELKLGIKHRVEVVVEKKHLASSLGSGGIDVFATPMMITLMEGTSLHLVQPLLAEGQTTVGTLVDVRHIAATPPGMKVYAEAELIEVDRKRLVFKVTAYDEKEMIGEGIHERFIVDSHKFLKKLVQK